MSHELEENEFPPYDRSTGEVMTMVGENLYVVDGQYFTICAGRDYKGQRIYYLQAIIFEHGDPRQKLKH